MAFCKNIVKLVPGKNWDVIEDSKASVVFVEVPEIELDENNRVVLSSKYEDPSEYIVPHAIQEETIVETDPLSLSQEFPKFDVRSLAVDKIVDAKTFEPPKIAIRSPTFLGIDDRRRNRRKQVFPPTATEKPAVCFQTEVKKAPPDPKDLMWLLDFKLDNFLQSNPLDEPCVNNTSSKKGDTKGETDELLTDSQREQLKKPPFTYTELIECALMEKGPLTVSEIYQWISDIFPYYKSWDDRWKNSVRHNLSINPYFRKGGKAKQGAGHLWTVSESAETDKSVSAKRIKYAEFTEYTARMNLRAEETDAKKRRTEEDAIRDAREQMKQMEDDAREAEIAIFNIIEDKENLTYQVPGDIQQSAGDILNGVKRNVAVEYIADAKAESSNDFLNPVSKEVLMGECGFINQMDLDSATEAFEIIENETNFDNLEDFAFHFTDFNCQTAQPV